MSVTKLKTIGPWQTARWQGDAVVDLRSNVRGRVITGMLTGGDAVSGGVVAPGAPGAPRGAPKD